MPLKVTDCAHLRLTVTDVDRSRAFYDAVFGVEAAYEALPEDADQTMGDQLAFLFGALSTHSREVCRASALSLRTRTGTTRSGWGSTTCAPPWRPWGDLQEAVGILGELQAPHGEIKDLGSGFILEFRDPANIALELHAPAQA